MKKSTVTLVGAVILSALWLLLGVVYRNQGLSNWQSDYAAATVHSLTPSPGSQAAQDFVTAYDHLQSANIVTAPVYYMQANEAHKVWGSYWR